MTQGTWYSGRSSMLSSDSCVVFLPRTLHTNSIYNFCTFVLSYFIFTLHIQLSYNAFLFTHARSSTLDWHRHQSSQLDSFSLFIIVVFLPRTLHLVDRYRRTKPPKPNASQFVVPARLPKPVMGSGGLSSSRFDDDVPEVNCT